MNWLNDPWIELILVQWRCWDGTFFTSGLFWIVLFSTFSSRRYYLFCLLSFALNTGWTGKIIYFYMFFQCLGSGSVGSARFWHPGSRSRSAKICGSTKNCKKNVTLKTQIWTNVKRVIMKLSWFLNGSSRFSRKINEKKSWKFCFVEKNSVNIKK